MTSYPLTSATNLQSPTCGGRGPTGYPPQVGAGWGANLSPSTALSMYHPLKVPQHGGAGHPPGTHRSAGNPPQWVVGRGASLALKGEEEEELQQKNEPISLIQQL